MDPLEDMTLRCPSCGERLPLPGEVKLRTLSALDDRGMPKAVALLTVDTSPLRDHASVCVG